MTEWELPVAVLRGDDLEMLESEPNGAGRALDNQAAELNERGYFQVLRGVKSDDGGFLVDGIAGKFWAANGNPLVRMGIGQAIYLVRIEDLEEALSDPAPHEDRNDPVIALEDLPTRGFCQGIRGALLMARFVLEVKDQHLLEPLFAMILDAWHGHFELQLGEERFVFDPADFWAALTDPATFRPDDYGPEPVDLL